MEAHKERARDPTICLGRRTARARGSISFCAFFSPLHAATARGSRATWTRAAAPRLSWLDLEERSEFDPGGPIISMVLLLFFFFSMVVGYGLTVESLLGELM